MTATRVYACPYGYWHADVSGAPNRRAAVEAARRAIAREVRARQNPYLGVSLRLTASESVNGWHVKESEDAG